MLFSLLGIAFAQQNEIAEIAKKIGAPGMQLVYVNAQGQQQSIVYGYKKVDDAALVTDQTIFQAASLTKVVAAYTFFRLYDRGLITLDMPLSTYYSYNRLQETKGGNAITARMVLTHHSGLLNWEGDVGTAEWRKTPLHTQFQPGSDYLYSGEGFYYLQLVMEQVTGKSFQELVEQEVLTPLGLKHSTIVWQDTLAENIAWGHSNATTPRKRLGKYHPANAAYSLYTTALDYTNFIQKALFKGVGLKSETHKLFLKECAGIKMGIGNPQAEHQVPLALGLRLQKNEQGLAYWHTGSNPGFRAFFILYPATGESLVSFCNTDTGMAQMQHVMRLFLDKNQTFWSYLWREGELD